MNQATFKIILAAVKVARLVSLHGIDPVECRLAIVELCDAVKEATEKGKLPKETMV